MPTHVVYLLYPTSNRNLRVQAIRWNLVVYLLYPTSNRNSLALRLKTSLLYISFILHQTATQCNEILSELCCISPLSYIKPQQAHQSQLGHHVVYLLYPTSNRNLSPVAARPAWVVYLLYPTSNRNNIALKSIVFGVVYLLYPTSNRNRPLIIFFSSRVVYLLYPTSNRNMASGDERHDVLYISFILHQTAT